MVKSDREISLTRVHIKKVNVMEGGSLHLYGKNVKIARSTELVTDNVSIEDEVCIDSECKILIHALPIKN